MPTKMSDRIRVGADIGAGLNTRRAFLAALGRNRAVD
jgi:hypothetical protein